MQLSTPSMSDLTLPRQLRYPTEREIGIHSIRSGTTHALKVVRIEVQLCIRVRSVALRILCVLSPRLVATVAQNGKSRK